MRAGLAQVRLRTRPIGLPQGQGGALEPGQTPACPGWAEPRPSPAPLCTQGIITFGEVKGSSPHPARAHGPGTVCRGTPHPTPICSCRHHTTMPDTQNTMLSETGSSLAQTVSRGKGLSLYQDLDPVIFPGREAPVPLPNWLRVGVVL